MTEILVVLGIILLIASMAFPSLLASRDKTRLTQCSSNLRHIAEAIESYSQRYKDVPGQDAELSTLLAYLLPASIFKCPDDEEEGADSYSTNYVGRQPQTKDKSPFLICPRHYGFERSTLIFADGSEGHAPLMPILANTGVGGNEEIDPGDVLTSGSLIFKDENSVNILSGSPRLIPIASYQLDGNRIHALVRVIKDSLGEIAVVAGPRVVIEVVTHAGVVRAENSACRAEIKKQTIGASVSHSTRVKGTTNTSLLTPTSGAYVAELPGGFILDKNSDSAYQPVKVTEGSEAEITRED